MNDSIITLHDFGVAYEKKTVLSDVNTAIRKNRITDERDEKYSCRSESRIRKRCQ